MSKEKEEGAKKTAKTSKSPEKSRSLLTDERIKFLFGILITGFALYLLIACVAYLFWWKTDQSLPDSEIVSGAEVQVKNWSGKSGHFLAKMMISYGFGYGAFLIPAIFGTIGLYLLNFPKIRLSSLIAKFTFAVILISLLLWFCFWSVKWLSDQRTRRCTGLLYNKVDEFIYGQDWNRSRNGFSYYFVPDFCL